MTSLAATLITALVGVIVALVQQARLADARRARDAARAEAAAAADAHARTERVVAQYRSEVRLCEEALRGTSDPAAVRARLRLLLAGDPPDA